MRPDPRAGLLIRALLLLAALLPPVASAAPGDVEPSCPVVLPGPRVQDLHAELATLSQNADCPFRGTRTDRARIVATWSTPAGAATAAATLVLSAPECMEAPPARGEDLALAPSPALLTGCPAVWNAVRTGLAERSFDPVDTIAIPSGGVPGPIPWLPHWLFVLTALGLLGLGARALRSRIPPPRPWIWAAAGAFALALIARALVPDALANWYTEVLPPEGHASGRFGPGVFLVQEAIRFAGLWNDVTWIAVNATIGALAAPVAVLIASELGLSLTAAAATAVLTSFSPYLVRISASPSEQVLASTLALGALALWLRGLRREDIAACLAAFGLAACSALTRVDMLFAMAAVAAWGILQHPKRWAFWATVAYGAAFTLFGLWSIEHVIVPSNHPPPTAEMVWEMVRHGHWLAQFPDVALRPPHWISPVSMGLVLVCLLTVRRRWRLLLGILVFLTLSFVPGGRDLDRDEVLSARYFLATLPVLLLAAGAGAATLARQLDRFSLPRLDHALVAALALSSVLVCWDAYGQRYTFQDEYDFLDEALTQLPEGCTVYQIPIRHGAYERDLDCCLWLGQSPLVLSHPTLDFRQLEPGRPVPPTETCAALYEGAVCAMDAERADDPRLSAASRIANQACAAAKRTPGLKLLEESTATGHVPNPLFPDRVPIRLYRSPPKP